MDGYTDCTETATRRTGFCQCGLGIVFKAYCWTANCTCGRVYWWTGSKTSLKPYYCYVNITKGLVGEKVEVNIGGGWQAGVISAYNDVSITVALDAGGECTCFSYRRIRKIETSEGGS